MNAAALKVIALLTATGSLSGFIAAQFIPISFTARESVAFYGKVSPERCAMAAAQTLSTETLTASLAQSTYFQKREEDMVPTSEIVESIQHNAAIKSTPNGFRVEFTDPNRLEALEIAGLLTGEMARQEGHPTRTVEPIRAGLKGPGPGRCTLIGMAGGLVLGLTLAFIQTRTRRVPLNS